MRNTAPETPETPETPQTSGRLFKSTLTPEGNDVQVPLWATAHELTHEPGIGYIDQTRGTTLESLKEDKIGESMAIEDAKGKTLYESIRDAGVKKPITIASAPNDASGTTSHMLYGGHHRLFSAEDIDPNMMIPLRYDNEIERHHAHCPTCSGEGVLYARTEIAPKGGRLPEYGDKFEHHNWRDYPDKGLGHHTLDVIDVEPTYGKPGRFTVHGSGECTACGGTGRPNFD